MATVAQAAALLDAKLGRGQWEPRIDLDTLYQGDSTTCVAGQLFPDDIGEYTNQAYKTLSIELAEVLGERASDIDAAIGPFGGSTTDEWRELLADRGFGREPVFVLGSTGYPAISFDSRTTFERDGDQLTITDYVGDSVTLNLAAVE